MTSAKCKMTRAYCIVNLATVLVLFVQVVVGVDFFLTADNEIEELWVDGVNIILASSTAGHWHLTTTVPLASNPSTIAINFLNWSGPSGLVASMSDGTFETDSTWKCLDQYQEGWETVGFDDSSWPNCVQFARINTGVWGNQFGWSSTAYWIGETYHQPNELWVRKRVKCPDSSWYQLGSNCYKIMTDLLRRDDAVSACSAMETDAFLVQLETREELDFIRDVIMSDFTTGPGKYWTSGHMEPQVKGDNSGTWYWGDGSEIEDLFWGLNEPNFLRGKEFCMNLLGSQGRNYEENDSPCRRKHGYICEKFITE